MDRSFKRSFRDILVLQQRLNEQILEKGSAPASICEFIATTNSFKCIGSERVKYYSGNVFQYERTEKGCSFISLGRDGKIGGVGYNQDIVNLETPIPPIKLTFRQFAFESSN